MMRWKWLEARVSWEVRLCKEFLSGDSLSLHTSEEWGPGGTGEIMTEWSRPPDGMETTGLLNEVAHPGWLFWKIFSQNIIWGRPRDEEPHIKRCVKKKKEMIEYIVRVNLQQLEIDENNFEELQELFRMFDNDKDGILSLKEFEKILSVLGRSGRNLV